MVVTFSASCIADFNDMKQKIETCLHVYDGKVKSYDAMEDAFGDLFHEAFSHTIGGGTIVDISQMRANTTLFLSMGTAANLLHYKRLGDHTFEAKLHFVNSLADIRTHLIGTIQDGKLVRIEAHEEVEPVHSQPKNNFEHFIQLQNDKDASANDLQDAFDCLFGDSLAAAIGCSQLHMRGMRTTSVIPEDFLLSEFSLEKFEIMDKRHIEVKVVRNCKLTHKVWHDVFTVEDGAILSIESFVNFKKGPAQKGRSRKRDRMVRLGPYP